MIESVMELGILAWRIATKAIKGFNLKTDKATKAIMGKTINLINTAPDNWVHATRLKLDKLRLPPMTIIATAIAASPNIFIGFKTPSGTTPDPKVKTMISAANMLNKGGLIIFLKSIRGDRLLVKSQTPKDHKQVSKPIMEMITQVYT